MKTLWMEIDDLQGQPGQTFRLGTKEVLMVCRGGEATFHQTDEGWTALREHDFSAHERIMQYDWTELHGQNVIILVVQRLGRDFPEDEDELQTEFVARTTDGVYYFLPFSYYDDGEKGGFKWKPTSADGLALLDGSLRRGTRSDPASRLLGSESMGELPDDATATKKAVKAGSR